MSQQTATKSSKATKSAKGKVNRNAKASDPRPKRLIRASERAREAKAILRNTHYLGEFIDCAKVEATLRAKVAKALAPSPKK